MFSKEDPEFLYLKDKSYKTKKEARALTEQAVRDLAKKEKFYESALEEDSLAYLDHRFPAHSQDDTLREDFAETLLKEGPALIDEEIARHRYIDQINNKLKDIYDKKQTDLLNKEIFFDEINSKIETIEKKISILEQKKKEFINKIDSNTNVDDMRLRLEFDVINMQLAEYTELLKNTKDMLDKENITKESLEKLQQDLDLFTKNTYPKKPEQN